MKNIVQLVVSVGAPFAAGAIGSIFTSSSVNTWYQTIAKPTLNPPSWVFGPVWSTLYALMGIAAFLVWRRGLRKHAVRVALALFGVQLILNALWSVLFFGLESPGWALVEIVFLWLAIAATLAAFWRVSRTAAYLLVPYLAWVSFAGYLNYSIWLLN